MKNDLKIAITTCDRKPPYIHRMLSSMFSSDPDILKLSPPRLVVDGSNTSFLGSWQKDSRLVIETHKDDNSKFHVFHRVCRNTVRAVTTGDTPLILFQDDVIFAEGWLHRLFDTVRDIEKTGYNFAESYILSLWTAGQVWGSTHQRFDPRIFHGNLALYMNVKARNKLSAYLCQRFEKYEEPDDVLVKNFCRFGGAAVFVTKPSLVQHIGEVSTGGSLVFVQAQTFGRRW